MNKLIGCVAAGALLLATGMGSPASARGGGHSGGHGGHGGGGGGGGWSGSSYGTSAIGGGSPVFRSNATVGSGGNATVGSGSPVFRSNNSAVRRGDRDGDRVRHRRRFIGPGVFAYDAYPDYYYDDGPAYTDDSGDCSYVLVRRNGVLHRVYTCQ